MNSVIFTRVLKVEYEKKCRTFSPSWKKIKKLSDHTDKEVIGNTTQSKKLEITWMEQSFKGKYVIKGKRKKQPYQRWKTKRPENC